MAKQKLKSHQITSELGYSEYTSVQSGITTEVDLTGLSVTVSVDGSTTILIEGYIPQIYSTVGTDRADFKLKEGATLLMAAYGAAGTNSNGWGGAYVRRRITPSAGSHTYKLTLTRTGTGSLAAYCDSSSPASIQVRGV